MESFVSTFRINSFVAESRSFGKQSLELALNNLSTFLALSASEPRDNVPFAYRFEEIFMLSALAQVIS